MFPHHENELAQSRAAGDAFARFWMHNGIVGMAGEKMSKSLGNVVSIPALVARYRPQELRYYLVAPHYRSTIEYSEAALEESVRAYQRIESFVQRVAARTGAVAGRRRRARSSPRRWTTTSARRRRWPRCTTPCEHGFTALDAGDEAGARGRGRAPCARRLGVLGLDPLAWASSSTVDSAALGALDTLVAELLETAAAGTRGAGLRDRGPVRDRLLAAGITVEDTPDGPQWTLKDG